MAPEVPEGPVVEPDGESEEIPKEQEDAETGHGVAFPVLEEKAEKEDTGKEVKSEGKVKKRKKKTSKDYAIEFAIKIAITAAAVAILCIFIVGIHVNHDRASYPMIKDGDLVITYKIGTPDLGEVVAYKHDGKVKFGRIVAREGDEVRFSDGYVMVNGYGLVEDSVYKTTEEGATITFPYIVPQGAVFVLNDYRSDPGDSRTYGAIPLADVEGEVIFILRRRGI